MLFTPRYDVRSRAFCGPTAISAVTGVAISEIRDAIRQTSGRIENAGRLRAIRGASNEDLVGAMKVLGWIATETLEPNRCRYNFGAFLNDHGHDGPFIVNVTGHYLAVSHGEVCDTFIKLPTDMDKYRRCHGKLVQRWWKFAEASTC